MKRKFIFLCAALLAGLLALHGQDQQTQNSVPTITFDRVWEAATPQSINFVLQETGSVHYLSRNPFDVPDNRAVDPDYTVDFTMSSGNLAKIFRDANEANFFHGDFNFKKHVVSSTGKKTLSYTDATRQFETTYDYSDNKAIQEITNIFQGISNTIEHGRKLQSMHRFDKLGLDSELKGMENAMESHNLAELQLIAPTLKSIAEDPAIMHIARQRAQKLLAKASSE
ncbi:MAG TPA: hypothetical protein VFB79_24010 [Candidatus Angelobacter sp.]|nr:hypothetical protein [Candidatus Angelobacter sp.]